MSLLGSDQGDEKTSFPSLPKQIQEDLQKFRKAQSRRMLHTRLHTYINHLCDGNKSPSESLPTGDGTSTVELENHTLEAIQNPILIQELTCFKQIQI